MGKCLQVGGRQAALLPTAPTAASPLAHTARRCRCSPPPARHRDHPIQLRLFAAHPPRGRPPPGRPPAVQRLLPPGTAAVASGSGRSPLDGVGGGSAPRPRLDTGGAGVGRMRRQPSSRERRRLLGRPHAELRGRELRDGRQQTWPSGRGSSGISRRSAAVAARAAVLLVSCSRVG